MILPAVEDQIVQSIASAIWKRPELARIREPVQKALEGNEFKKLVKDALSQFAANTQDTLPAFMREEFVLQDRTLRRLAAFVVQRDATAIDELADDYAKNFHVDEHAVRATLSQFLIEFRETLAIHPHYGAILLARDLQGMTAALNNLRHEIHGRFDEVISLLNKLLAAPDFKALVEKRTGTHVFLSYSSRDSARAIEIRNALQDAGHEVWQDVTTLVGGTDWQKSIVDGIKRAYVVVLVMSEQSNNSHWVNEEFLLALDLKKRIVPIKIDDCENRFGTRGLHIVSDISALIVALPGVSGGGGKTGEPDTDVMPLPDDEKSQRQLEEEYLAELFLKYRVWQKVYTPLAGVGQMRVEEADNTDIEITDEGIEMAVLFDDFMDSHMKDSHPVKTQERDYDNILQALDDMRQLVILGDPGSGKSTTIWRIAADYAEHARGDTSQPIPVILRMGEVKGNQTIEQYLMGELGELGRCFDALMEAKRLILLFDGLNELPREYRSQRTGEVKALIERCQRDDMIAVVTCRELDYVHDLDMSINERLVIAPLDPLRIKQFVNAYITKPAGKGDELFWMLAGKTASDTWQRFQKDVDIPLQEYLFWLADELPDQKTWSWLSDDNSHWENWLRERHHPRNMMTLARNPFMLFMLTKVFTKKGEIPQNRGELFGLFADFMLQREKLDPQTADALKGRLADLAFEMQQQGEGTAFGEAAVRSYLAEIDLYVARSASILSEGDPVRFTHQLLQEYFAALRLDIERKKGIAATTFWHPDSWWNPNEWNETAILMVGLYGDDCIEVIEWLRDANPELAQRCILESGAHTPQSILDTLQPRWLPRLTDFHSDPTPHARTAVGRAVGKLSLDNRAGVGRRADGLPDIVWCEISAGMFLMGSDKRKDERAYDDETPQFEVNLPLYYVSQYPITNAQYRAFMDAEGYTNRQFWTAAGWERKEQFNWTQPEYWDNDRYNVSNQPVVGVSWYEAYAFTRWLNAAGAALKPDSTLAIRLLTEQEREKAARGVDGRIYPYGDAFDAGKGNVSETGIGTTSAAGIFPHGASPYGVLDMSGNVYDWCMTKWRGNYQEIAEDNHPEGTDMRVVRGGSFFFNSRVARAAFRDFSGPLSRLGNFGFRVCVAPILGF